MTTRWAILCAHRVGQHVFQAMGKEKKETLLGSPGQLTCSGERKDESTGWELDNLRDKTPSHLDSGAGATLKVMG